LSCGGEPRNGWCWVTLAGASSLRALGFAEQSGEWQRSEFEWIKVGGEPSLIGDVNEKPLCFKMMAAVRGSNIESWKARADSSSDVQDVGD
jgi:hypothetical protein